LWCCTLGYTTSFGYKLGELRGVLSIKLPAGTVKAQAWETFSHGLGIHLAGFILIFVMVVWLVRRYITCPMEDLSKGMRSVAGGDYARRMMGFEGEFKTLGDTFNHMTEKVQEQQDALRTINAELEDRVARRTADLAQANAEISGLNEQLKSENLRMGAELEVSRKIQQMVLPTTEELHQVNGLDIAGFMEAASEVGGDYYDVLQHNGSTKIGIGDVTGHGLESGVVMLMVQMGVRTLLANGVSDPQTFLQALNRAVFQNMQRMKMDKNLTLALLDYSQGKLRLVGQHEEVIVARRDGRVERVDTIQLGHMIGLQPEIGPLLGQIEIDLEIGDGIVLYTDGVTEAQNQAEDRYGVDRLLRMVSNAWEHHSAEHIQQAIVADLREYMTGQPVADDITLLIIKRNK
jgi:sigma-B regulation protein RsbU (phosphoserine phosphatase)